MRKITITLLACLSAVPPPVGWLVLKSEKR
jgi:hypothetical protein